jgi:putative NIF3 family GTP cyclohydrolase 1 type 2
LRQHLLPHEVVTAYERGWATLRNGELLSAAEAAGFDVFVTTDTNLRYQQNLSSRTVSVIVLSATSRPRIRVVADRVAEAVDQVARGGFVEVLIP